MMEQNEKLRLMCAAAALTLMLLPVSCGTNGNNNTTSNGMNGRYGVNENGIYDGSNTGRNIADRAGDAIDDAGNAIERGADRVEDGLDRMGDDMTGTTASTTRTATTTSTTRTAASVR